MSRERAMDLAIRACRRCPYAEEIYKEQGKRLLVEQMFLTFVRKPSRTGRVKTKGLED